MVNIDRQPRRHLGGRLHGQPGHRASRGRPARATSRCRSTTCCRPGTRSPAPWPRPGCWRPSATARRTGEGQLVKVALSDVAFAMVGNLGKIAEAQLCRRERPKDGNYLYGAFGRDFLTSDGRRIMVVALTAAPVDGAGRGDRARRGLRAARADASGVDLEQGGRPLRGPRGDRRASLKPWTTARTLDEIREVFDAHGVCWGPYQTFMRAGRRGPALLDREPDVRGGRAARDRHLPDAGLAAATSAAWSACRCAAPRCSASTPRRSSPRCSGLSDAEIGRLHDDGVVATQTAVAA